MKNDPFKNYVNDQPFYVEGNLPEETSKSEVEIVHLLSKATFKMETRSQSRAKNTKYAIKLTNVINEYKY